MCKYETIPYKHSACHATNAFTQAAVKGLAVAYIHGVIKQFSCCLHTWCDQTV